MKLLKIINISSNGSYYFNYRPISLIKKNNRNIFLKYDDKNFVLNRKRKINSNTFKQSLNYKRKYIKTIKNGI